jgi:hypothetical protein
VSTPRSGVPELAGLATYAGAARIGYSVEDNVRRLLRYQWTERRLMHDLVSHLTAEPVWEVKCGYALHQWQDAEHVDWLRRRVGEMRHPVPALDTAPDRALETLLQEMLASADAVELLAGSHAVVRAALADAYREHLDATNPLVDHPTRRILQRALLDHETALAWGEAALAALTRDDPSAAARGAAWRDHLRAHLEAAGGIAGPAPERTVALPVGRAIGPHVPDFHPRRDRRFTGQRAFEFPPHAVYNDPGSPRTSATWPSWPSAPSRWTCPR